MKYYKLSSLPFAIALIMFLPEINCRVIKETSTYKQLELLDENKFIYRQEVSNGKKDEIWYVNEKEVSAPEFAKLKLESRIKEWQREEIEKENKRLAEQQFLLNSKLNLIKKLLNLKNREIRAALDRIKSLEKQGISAYFLYSSETLASKEDLNLLEAELARQKESVVTCSDPTELEARLNKIESYPDRLNKFFQQSVDNAIKNCDDTKLLKDLLMIVN